MSDSEETKQTRRARRAEAAGSETEEIRDRNKKLRADGVTKRQKERQRELAVARTEGLGAGERVDDALVRSADATSRFFRDHFKWLQWLVVGGIAGSMAYLVLDYRRGVEDESHGHELDQALLAVSGRLVAAEPLVPADRNLVDTRPEFATADARFTAASKAWSALDGKSPELTLLAKLGRSSVLYDQAKYAEARDGYEASFVSSAATRFPELRARAQEGVALCLEAEGKPDDALKALATLKDLGAAGMGDLASYHTARIQFKKGDVEGAKTALLALMAKLSKKRSPTEPPAYLEAAAEDLLKTVDPTRAATPGGISAAQLEQLKKQFEAMKAGGSPAPLELPSGALDAALSDPLDAPPLAPNAAPAPAALSDAPSAAGQTLAPSPKKPAAAGTTPSSKPQGTPTQAPNAATPPVVVPPQVPTAAPAEAVSPTPALPPVPTSPGAAE